MGSLGFGRKLAYAMGGIALNLANLVISQWLFVRYVPSEQAALVPAAWFGAFLMLGRLTDAVTDPLIGYLSDNTRTRWGRRIPYILFGAVPLALVFCLLWTPPVGHQHWFNALYACALIQLYFLLYTAVCTPYLSLLPEISPDAAERINISTMQAIFIMVGTVVFGGIGIILERWGWLAIGLVVAALTLISFVPTVLVIRERPPARPPAGAPAGLVTWLKLTLTNRPFLYVVVATSLYWIALNLVLMLVPFWVTDYLGLKKDAVTLLMAPFLASNVVFFFVVNVLAKRFGKYLLFLITLLGSALVIPLVTLVGHLPWGTPFAQSALVFGLAGVPVAGFLVLPYAILADVVDHDEQRTGLRREAIFFGVQAIFQKSAIALSIVVFGLLVHVGAADGSALGLRIVAGLAGLACLIGFFVFLGYPLRSDRPR
ncbi:MAG: MFS transporter [Deltaproteobacteria bacterium]|nr:MFS transporter [Deltaproteobacteria bacterium]